jgi:hypothetical protein
MGGPWRAVCNKAGWCRPAGPKSNVNGWPHASDGKKAAPSSSRKWIEIPMLDILLKEIYVEFEKIVELQLLMDFVLDV